MTSFLFTLFQKISNCERALHSVA